MIGTAYAQAAGGAPQGCDTLMGMLPIVLMFVIMYFILIRPQMKKAKEHKTMLDALQKGDEVIAVGILGKIAKITDNYLSLEIAPNVTIQVQKSGGHDSCCPRAPSRTRSRQMNKYPLWKYVMIAIAILVSVTYAVPNLFGEVPAVQVSPLRATVKVDEALRARRSRSAQGRQHRARPDVEQDGRTRCASASPTPMRS